MRRSRGSMSMFVTAGEVPTAVQYERTIAALRELKLTSWRMRWRRWVLLQEVRLLGLPTQDDLDAIAAHLERKS